jgi:hypothetical protein
MILWSAFRRPGVPLTSDDTWLTLLRVGLGLHLAAYCFSLSSVWSFFLGGAEQGFIGRELLEALATSRSSFIPTMSWIVHPLVKIGLTEEAILNATFVALFLAACSLLAGLFCRTAAVVAWLLHLCAAKSGGFLSYGLDSMMTIGLFYLMLSPLPDRRALDAILWASPAADPKVLGLFRLLLQLHLCIIYFFGGLTKALGAGWWNGESLWRALTRSPFDVLPPDLVVQVATFLPPLGIAVWVVELAYPLMIWPHRTRAVWLVLTCGMHVGIGAAMGMYLFALVMIVLNVAAFWPEKWPLQRSRGHNVPAPS